MANLSGLATISTTATALSNLVIVAPQQALGYVPQSGILKFNGPTISYQNALVFDYEGEQSVELKSEITDHYVEDNIAVQDQVSLAPIRITTHGFIGELNDIAPYPLQILRQLADKLTVISAYTPQLSVTALLAYNEAFQAYQLATNAINAGVSAWSTIGGQSQVVIDGASTFSANNIIQNKQQALFTTLFGYYRSRSFFTIQTPWAVFVNMVIESLRAIQDEKTRTITDFQITFKQIRVATTSTISSAQAEQIVSGRLEQQQATDIYTGNVVAQQLSTFSFVGFIP